MNNFPLDLRNAVSLWGLFQQQPCTAHKPHAVSTFYSGEREREWQRGREERGREKGRKIEESDGGVRQENIGMRW